MLQQIQAYLGFDLLLVHPFTQSTPDTLRVINGLRAFFEACIQLFKRELFKDFNFSIITLGPSFKMA